MMNALIKTLTPWDLAAATRVFGSPLARRMDRAIRLVSRSADGPAYFFLVLAALATFGGNPELHGRVVQFALAMLAGYGIELPAYKLIKSKIRRPRPFQTWPCRFPPRMSVPDHFSFPSGHTAGAFVLAAILSWQLPWITPLIFTWAATVGFSRVYLGVHYPSDTIAGAVLGLVSAGIGIALATG